MKHSSDFSSLSLDEQCRTYALAYLAQAEATTERLLQDDRHTYADGSVAMGLARHSVELMLKAVLIKKDPHPQQNGHSLEHLARLYRGAWPELAWDVPFLTQVIGEDDEAAAEKTRREHDKDFPIDQRHRYPMDRNFMLWKINGAFDATSFFKLLSVIRTDFERIINHVWGVAT